MKINLIICVDVDPNGLNVPGVSYRKKELSWSTLINGAKRLIEIEDILQEQHNINVNFNWFLRSDSQINEVYGSYDWALKEFEDTWEILAERGDGMGWHPHFWRWYQGNETSGWYQEHINKEWMMECLKEGYNAFYKHFRRTLPVRMGWAYHDNETMKMLDSLGIEIDLSAIPSLRSEGRRLDGAFCDKYDWSETEEKVYHPSLGNYMMNGRYNLSITEVPMSVTRDKLPNALYGKFVHRQFSTWGIDKHPLTPISETDKFSWAIKRYVREIKRGSKQPYIGLYFHPTDLYTYEKISLFEKNIGVLIRTIKEENERPYFINIEKEIELITRETAVI